MQDFNIGDKVRITLVNGKVLQGIVMPLSELDPKDIVIIKLENGYNIGVKKDKIKEVEVLQKFSLEEEVKRKIVKKEGLPIIGMFATGGTIGSKVDYRTGAVTAKYSAEDIISLVPDIADVVNLDGYLIFNELSENFEPKHWKKIANKIIDEDSKNNYDGIVITHGTDTMAFSASALSFMLENLSKPVVFTGAQRSSDRPSSDVYQNLLSASLFAGYSNCAEVVIIMHGETEDTYCLAHRGVRAKKMHTSRRDAFVSVNEIPLFKIYPEDKKIINLNEKYKKSEKKEPLEGFTEIEEKVVVIKHYPGLDPEIIHFVVDKGYKGIVFEGTGLGHINSKSYEAVKRANEEGVVMVMVSQCIFGRINMNVYSTGRMLQKYGIIPGEDMTLEAAYGKLCYLLGKYQDNINKVKTLITENLRGEISKCSDYRVSRPPKFFYHENIF